jgi:hypothetical protein
VAIQNLLNDSSLSAIDKSGSIKDDPSTASSSALSALPIAQESSSISNAFAEVSASEEERENFVINDAKPISLTTLLQKPNYIYLSSIHTNILSLEIGHSLRSNVNMIAVRIKYSNSSGEVLEGIMETVNII